MNEREPTSARARQLRAAAVITAVWFFGVTSAHACLELLPSYGRVGPSFVVKLRDPENRPIPGMRVRVRERNSSRGVVPKEIASAITDETGTATFSGLRWGWNWLEVDHPAGEMSGGLLVVDSIPGHAVRETAWITWPRAAVIKASTLTGALQTESGALADAQVELLHGASGTLLETQHTDALGRFAFTEKRAGLYFLRYADWKRPDIKRFIYFEVVPTAAQSSATIRLKRNRFCEGRVEYEQRVTAPEPSPTGV